MGMTRAQEKAMFAGMNDSSGKRQRLSDGLQDVGQVTDKTSIKTIRGLHDTYKIRIKSNGEINKSDIKRANKRETELAKMKGSDKLSTFGTKDDKHLIKHTGKIGSDRRKRLLNKSYISKNSKRNN